MSGLSGFQLKWMRFIGRMPRATKIEERRAAREALVERCLAYMESSDYKRHQECVALRDRGGETDDSVKEDLRRIEKSSEYKWFQKQMKAGVLEGHEASRVEFFDDFGGGLDPQKWSTRFFWGDAQVGQAYSFVGDPHAYTDGANVSVANGRLVISTRRESVQSLAWDAKMGFLPREFDYTSGVVTTGHSFRMRRGTFEAKIRYTAQEGVYHAFYLVGDSALPQIDVFRTVPGDDRVLSGVYCGSADSKHEASVGKLPYSSEFFILSVEVGDSSLVWKINGVAYLEQQVKLPKQPLYLVLLSGVAPGATPSGESKLEVDWVRCQGDM
ncbi:MAG: hypothetical protein CSA97_05005 [Bacteroidetes bacterium]|nr:MAG: hypothetical protein CSA97_05005 [Bacteroidota bacterium]